MDIQRTILQYVLKIVPTLDILKLINYLSLLLIVADCGPLNDPDNGQVDTPSGTTFRSIATYTCDTGFRLFGSLSRTCRADGLWTSTDPFCEGAHLLYDKITKLLSCISF